MNSSKKTLKIDNILFYEPIGLLFLMWCIFILNLVLPVDLIQYGIKPRQPSGLLGIFTMPILHINLSHIISNSLPFLILASLLRLQGRNTFWTTTLFIVLSNGIIVWLLAHAGVTVGASGLIFGYWAFLITHAFYRKSIKSIAISLLVFVLYGSLIFSFFQFKEHISWIAHISGAFSGWLAAKYFHTKYKQKAMH